MKAENELCELLDQVNAEAMLSAMAAQLLLRSVEEVAGDKYGNHSALLEVIAFYAIPRFGVNTGKCVSHWDFNQSAPRQKRNRPPKRRVWVWRNRTFPFPFCYARKQVRPAARQCL